MIFRCLAVLPFACALAACGSGGKQGYSSGSPGSVLQDPDSGGLGGSSGSPGLGGDTDSGGASCAASVTAAKRAEVDIIILIDTSGSMSEETAQVQQNINDFAKSIGQSGLDYRVVLVAEKPLFPGFPLGICVPAPLGGANCADNAPLFHHINQDVASTDSLELILSTYDQWKGYLRSTSYKVFIEITDDNSSLDYQSFDSQLLQKQPAGIFGDANSRKYIFDSICGWQDGTPVLSGQMCSSAVNTGSEYQHLSQLTGGTVDSVCKTSYAGVFSNLAKGLVTKLGCEFSLPQPDGGTLDPSTVAVQYTPGGGAPKPLTRVTDPSKCAANPDGWYYDSNTAPTKIVFCQELCSTAGVDTSGKVEVLAGCKAPPAK